MHKILEDYINYLIEGIKSDVGVYSHWYMWLLITTVFWLLIIIVKYALLTLPFWLPISIVMSKIRGIFHYHNHEK
jgi:hypothetical protein